MKIIDLPLHAKDLAIRNFLFKPTKGTFMYHPAKPDMPTVKKRLDFPVALSLSHLLREWIEQIELRVKRADIENTILHYLNDAESDTWDELSKLMSLSLALSGLEISGKNRELLTWILRHDLWISPAYLQEEYDQEPLESQHFTIASSISITLLDFYFKNRPSASSLLRNR